MSRKDAQRTATPEDRTEPAAPGTARTDPLGMADPGRRDALELGALACGAGVLALACWPAAAVFLGGSPQPDGEAPWVDAAAEAELIDGQPAKASAQGLRRDGWMLARGDLGAVWVVKRSGAIRAFSAICPHLGCVVDARPSGGYACPCHASDFSADGERLSGPSPRGLDALPVRIEAGRVLVQMVGPAQRKAV